MSDWITTRARVELLSTNEGGPSNALRSGYRGTLRFDGAELDLGFQLDLGSTSALSPGAAVECNLSFWTVDALNVMAKSQRFELREDLRVIGRGSLVYPTKPTEEQIASFRAPARAVLAATPLADRLQVTSAIVLERIACGAGSTNWYHCDSRSDLERLASEVIPGSMLSFYFDRRFTEHRGAEAQSAAKDLGISTEEVLVGILAHDGFHIDMKLPDRSELQELFEEVPPDARVFVGVFPERDNDEFSTIAVPDLDGVVRPHPY